MRKTALQFIAIGMIAVFASSCAEEEVVEKLPEYDRADSLSVDYLRELGNIRTSIEQSSQLYKLLLDEGYSYNGSLLISASKSYSGSRGQALGLGAAGADLSYATTFEQAQDAQSYVKQIMNCGNGIGIAAAFDEKVLAKLAEVDSTVNKSVLLTKAYLRAEDQLYSEDRAQLATLMVVGGWIEGLYLATSMVKDKPANNEVAGAIWNQTYTYNNVMHMLKVFEESSADCKEVIEKLNGAKGAISKVLQSNGTPNAAQINELNTAIASVRKDLVG